MKTVKWWETYPDKLKQDKKLVRKQKLFWAIDWVVINVFTKKKNREERMCLSLANISYRKIKRMK